ncbi:hypothetical protein V7274_10585 [Bacillus pumilus]|uniref:hypothetical protein n=1 Tax=Bacillus pumilus TaxID=1408 RepID=UPI00227E90A2|nr:hypothetical protein [Bacillus pumilus]MCY7680159.1 hypothetical protein [Bacillus pumilus]MDR0121191.1 hypothetical protein [Bacillus pumilus]
MATIRLEFDNGVVSEYDAPREEIEGWARKAEKLKSSGKTEKIKLGEKLINAKLIDYKITY